MFHGTTLTCNTAFLIWSGSQALLQMEKLIKVHYKVTDLVNIDLLVHE